MMQRHSTAIRTSGRTRMALAALLIFLLSAPALAQVAKQIPDDALMVIKVSALKPTSEKIANFFNELGLAQMEPALADPMESIKGELGITGAGLDDQGEAAFIFRDPARVGGDPEKAFLLLIPVSDYQAFLGNFANPQSDGAVTQVAIGESAEPGFVAQWGNYAALSPAKEAVAAVPTSMLPIKGQAEKAWAADDLILYANIPALRAKLVPEIQANRQNVLDEVASELQHNPQMATFKPLIQAIVNQGINVAESSLRDAEAATVGVKLGEEGVSFDLLGEFQPGSYVGNVIASLKGQDSNLLAGLPAGNYLVYGGGTVNSQAALKLTDDLLNPVIAEVTALGPQYQAVSDFIAEAKRLIGATQGQSFGMVKPEGMLGAEPIIQYVTVYRGDANTIKESTRALMEKQSQLMAAFGVPAELYQTNYQPGAKTVGGVTFDLLSQTVNPPANDPMAMQQAQMMAMMYGPEGMQMHLATVGDKLLGVSGLSDDKITAAITAVRNNASPLAQVAGVKAVSGKLPGNRLAEVYVSLDQILGTGIHYAQQFGMPLDVELPPDLPPIGTAISTQGSALSVETYVPTNLIQAVIAAGMQSAMQMQGGGQFDPNDPGFEEMPMEEEPGTPQSGGGL